MAQCGNTTLYTIDELVEYALGICYIYVIIADTQCNKPVIINFII